ncbi:MAG: 5'-nucleotidase, partial [Chlorobi bacterium OLB4]
VDQNSPKPDKPVTKINFSIPQSGFVSMKVYDAMGREVATLVSENKTQGTYTVKFNGADFSSGVYFVRMQAGDFSQVRRMVLVK